MEDFLKQLNEQQRAAVEQTDGPVMVVAGAGSGKTRVLTYKVAYLIHQGIDPFRILALTFTNKAAREMKERITQLVGSEAKNVWMGTFHSIFARILRSEGHLLGYPSNFTIYDTNDAKNVIKKVVKELNLDPKTYPANVVYGRISSCKNNLIDAEAYNRNTDLVSVDRAKGRGMMGLVFTNYQKALFHSKAMDFDDLLFKTNVLFRDFPETLQKYQNKFQYILVDEYQDTNFSQYLIVKKLSANNANICVVGDDAQSIYAFRGANIENILKFKHDYPGVKQFKLEQNYRSTKNIVNAANSLIEKNKDQIAKVVWTDNNDGEKIKLIKAGTDTEEGKLVAQSIFENAMNYRAKYRDFAVLYRTNAQSRTIEEALRKINIPYQIFGGLSFYQRKEIKDMLAYYRLTINNLDEEALLRIINYPTRGIGNTTLQKIMVLAQKSEMPIWEALENKALLKANFSQTIINKLTKFTTMIGSFSSLLKKRSAFDLAKHIALKSGLFGLLNEDKTNEGVSRVNNLEELLNAIYVFTHDEDIEKDFDFLEDEIDIFGKEIEEEELKTLDVFMQDVALITDQDKQTDKKDADRVSLMTIHAAKGLEFPYVYILGLEEKLFPNVMSMDTRAALEEERRLFYVALTRAEKKAHVSYAESRYRWGNLTFSEPSRFIYEVDTKYFSNPIMKKQRAFETQGVQKAATRTTLTKATSYKKLTTIDSQSVNQTPKKSSTDEYKVLAPSLVSKGLIVEHQFFGRGKVINVSSQGPNTKAIVHFDKVGEKNLLLRFAKLKILKD